MQVSLTIVGTFDEDWAAGSNPPFTLKMTFGGVESEDVSLETKEYLENLFRRGVMIPVGRRLKDEVERKRKRRAAHPASTNAPSDSAHARREFFFPLYDDDVHGSYPSSPTPAQPQRAVKSRDLTLYREAVNSPQTLTSTEPFLHSPRTVQDTSLGQQAVVSTTRDGVQSRLQNASPLFPSVHTRAKRNDLSPAYPKSGRAARLQGCSTNPVPAPLLPHTLMGRQEHAATSSPTYAATLKQHPIPPFIVDLLVRRNAPRICYDEIHRCVNLAPGYDPEKWHHKLSECGSFEKGDIELILPIIFGVHF